VTVGIRPHDMSHSGWDIDRELRTPLLATHKISAEIELFRAYKASRLRLVLVPIRPKTNIAVMKCHKSEAHHPSSGVAISITGHWTSSSIAFTISVNRCGRLVIFSNLPHAA